MSTETIKYVNKETGKWESIDALTGEIVSLERMYQPEKKVPYSVAIARAICMQVRVGKSLKDIANQPNMPSYETICLWKYRYPDFKEGIKEAHVDSAQYHADKVLELAAEECIDKTELENKKVYIDALKWKAEKEDPNKFGKHTKITGDENAPVAIFVNTGIEREK